MIRAGDTITAVRTAADLVEGRFRVLHVLSALSGPSYYLHVAPVDAPDADFYGRWFTRWGKEDTP